MGYELRDVVAFLAAVGTVSGLLIAYIRYSLGGDFAKTSDVAALAAKVTLLEQRIERMPSHEDMRSLGTRIGEVERGVAVVHAKVDGATELLKRIAHHTDMLMQHQLDEEKGP